MNGPVISESSYKGSISQRNNRKVTMYGRLSIIPLLKIP